MRVTSAVLSGIATSFNAILNQRLNTVRTSWARVAMETRSTGAKEIYPWLGDISGMREWIGDRVADELSADGFEVRNRDYEKTIRVKRKDIEDDAIGLYQPMAAMLAQSAAELPDQLVWSVVRDAFNVRCYDGTALCAEDHPVEDAVGKQRAVSNCQPGTSPGWYLLDTSRPVMPIIYQLRQPPRFASLDKVDDAAVFARGEYYYGVDMRCAAAPGLWQLIYGSRAELTPENFSAAYTAMTTMLGDRDRQLRITPTLLVVPPTLREAAIRILKSERLPDQSANPNRDLVDLHVESYLA